MNPYSDWIQRLRSLLTKFEDILNIIFGNIFWVFGRDREDCYFEFFIFRGVDMTTHIEWLDCLQDQVRTYIPVKTTFNRSIRYSKI
jgi:hypothetical protein